MAKPLLSIIVPCYNHASYLQQRFDSIFSQAITDFELIVLDDASRDCSRRLLEQILANKPHVFLPNVVNSGSPFKQWERGLKVASGKYVWIAESDDCCAPDFIASLLGPLECNDLALAFSKVQSIDASSNYLDVPYWPEALNPEFFHASQVVSCRFFLQNFMGSRNCLPNASAVVFRADEFKPKILDLATSINTFKFAGDWIFWAKLLAAYGEDSLAYVSDPLCFHRIHEGATRVALDKEREKVRIREFSSAVNTINSICSTSSLRRIIQLLVSDSWDWSYFVFLRRYQPSLLEKLSGSPQVGLHRFGYILYSLRCLASRFKSWFSNRCSIGSR